jgi:NADH dehydrogenase (ubiquinone) Fe-S protein 6
MTKSKPQATLKEFRRSCPSKSKEKPRPAESHRTTAPIGCRSGIGAPSRKPRPPTSSLRECRIPSTLTLPLRTQLQEKMLLPIARSRIAVLSSTWAPRVASQSRAAAAAYSTTVPRFSENTIPANDPTPRKPKPNVSETNATPVDSMGEWDVALQESTDVAERVRTMQAPNRATTWAPSQRPRAEAMSGPRFEQTIMHLQVCYLDTMVPWLSAESGERGMVEGITNMDI